MNEIYTFIKQMRDSDLEINRWNSLRESDRLSLAESLARQLPDGFRLVGIRSYALGDQQNNIALFEYQSSIFSLIPGAEVTLGYDENYPFEPNQQQYESWLESVEGDGFDVFVDLNQFINSYTTALRTCTFKPMLIEVNSHEIGLERISNEEPVIQKILAEYPDSSQVEISQRYRVVRNQDGSIDAFQLMAKTHHQVVEEMMAEGFYLPTSDEWEYACGSGSRTLFRWGNDCPCDCYPIYDKPNGIFHQVPNAFGLHIAEDPYNREIVAEPSILRGGDGGSAMCGGCSCFVSWVSLATAFFIEENEDDLSQCFARRVYRLNL